MYDLDTDDTDVMEREDSHLADLIGAAWLLVDSDLR